MTRQYAAWITAAALLMAVVLAAAPQQTASAERQLEAAIHREQVLGDVKGAIEEYKKLAQSASRAVAAQALVRLGQCYEKLGEAQVTEARASYERVVREFGDQAEVVAQARARLAALGGSRGAAGAGGLVARRLLTDASGIGDMLTADGKHIRGIDWDTGDVTQFEIATGQKSRTTNRSTWGDADKANEEWSLSRDGRQIAYNAFVRTDAKEWFTELRIRNLDGSGARTLYSEKATYFTPVDWSPDAGAILAVRDRGEVSELMAISTADGSTRVLKSAAPAWWIHASYSPDGRSIALSHEREGRPPHGDVFLMTADGRNEVLVAGHPAEDRLLGWAPDGTRVVFLSDRSGTWDIWAVRVSQGKQQGEPQLLKKDFGYSPSVLGFAPDGSCYYSTETSSGRLYNGAIDLETGKVLVSPVPVPTRYTSPPAGPTWSPDGRNLAYVSRRGPAGPGNNILTIRSAETGEERFLSPRLRYIEEISWAPNSRSILTRGTTEAGSAIYRIDTETSGITKLLDRGHFPKLCPDGTTLVLADGSVMKKRDLTTGEESEFVKVGVSNYALSPDCREVAFQGNGAVKIVPVSGGEPREVFRSAAHPDWNYRLEWTRDGRYIIAEARQPGIYEIWRVPAQGGTALKLDLAVRHLPRLFTLDPDGRRFAYIVSEASTSELWVLEGLVPPLKGVK